MNTKPIILTFGQAMSARAAITTQRDFLANNMYAFAENGESAEKLAVIRREIDDLDAAEKAIKEAMYG